MIRSGNGNLCLLSTGSSVVDESLCLDAPSRAPRPPTERRCDVMCPAATLWQPPNVDQLDMASCRAAGVLCRSQQQDTAPAWTCAAPQGASQARKHRGGVSPGHVANVVVKDQWHLYYKYACQSCGHTPLMHSWHGQAADDASL